MKLGVVGLGKMGVRVARRLLDGGHECVVFDKNPARRANLVDFGASTVSSLDHFTDRLIPPRIVWIMVPSGEQTEKVIEALATTLAAGDITIDGGNTHYTDDVRRSSMLIQRGIHHVDVGTSGGVYGLQEGFCLTIGGDREVVRLLSPIFEVLAASSGGKSRGTGRVRACGPIEQGYCYCGPAGAGHFVKMVHNAIEYGMMQALAEGLELLVSASSDKIPVEERYDLDIAEIFAVWERGSLIRSRLLCTAAEVLAEDGSLTEYSDEVADSGTGRWAVQVGASRAVPTPVLAAALYERFRSQSSRRLGGRLLAAMRKSFGGHPAGTEGAD